MTTNKKRLRKNIVKVLYANDVPFINFICEMKLVTREELKKEYWDFSENKNQYLNNWQIIGKEETGTVFMQDENIIVMSEN